MPLDLSTLFCQPAAKVNDQANQTYAGQNQVLHRPKLSYQGVLSRDQSNRSNNLPYNLDRQFNDSDPLILFAFYADYYFSGPPPYNKALGFTDRSLILVSAYGVLHCACGTVEQRPKAGRANESDHDFQSISTGSQKRFTDIGAYLLHTIGKLTVDV